MNRLVVDRGLLWMVTPGIGGRRFVLDCPHATTEYTLPTQRPRDDSTDYIILFRLMDQHRLNVLNDLSAREDCGCTPVRNRTTGAKPRISNPIGTADELRERLN